MGWSDLSTVGFIGLNDNYFDLNVKSIRVEFLSSSDVKILRHSLIENITLTLDKNAINKESLSRAIEVTDLDSLVQARQFGGEALDIRSLSGGQLQRICNRSSSCTDNREILLMDEATDGLDEESERDVLCKIRTYYPKNHSFVDLPQKSAADLADKVVEIRQS